MSQVFNSDVQYNGIRYHIQTEDWGEVSLEVVTKVFRGGAVVAKVRTPYANIPSLGEQEKTLAVGRAMKSQHQKILDHILSGQLLK